MSKEFIKENFGWRQTKKTKFDYLYTRRGFKKIESDLEDTALKRLNERLSKIDVSRDYN